MFVYRAPPLRKVEGIIFSFQLKKREREGRKVVEKLIGTSSSPLVEKGAEN